MRVALVVAAFVAVGIAAALLWFARGPELAPDILLISVDTVRADHCSAYGYDRPTTPFLEDLARDGVLFENATSTAPWTLPSIATLHTGLYPSEHGAMLAHSRVDPELPTLAEQLRAADYQTVAIISHSFIDSTHGLGQGFDIYDESLILGHEALSSQLLTERALAVLDTLDRTRPVFLWVHYFDPHFSYVEHPGIHYVESDTTRWPTTISALEMDTRLAELRETGSEFAAEDLDFVKAVYDEELAHTDQWMGKLAHGTRDLRGDRRQITAVTADHGEYFLERGRFFHGQEVYTELVDVPLVIGGDLDQRLRGQSVQSPVSAADLPYTLLRLANVPLDDFPGRDLLDLDQGVLAAAPVFMEGLYAWGEDNRKVGVVAAGHKLILHRDSGRRELYDLQSDPDEKNDLLLNDKAPADILEKLTQLANDFPPRRARRGGEVFIDDETLERLRSLGYTN